jgi:hypothetical protein
MEMIDSRSQPEDSVRAKSLAIIYTKWGVLISGCGAR